MMGKDIERIVSLICNMIDVIESCIDTVASSAHYRIETQGEHGEKEKKNELQTTFLKSAESALMAMEDDINKMNNIRDQLYTSSTTFNNSHGSPWKELNDMKRSIQEFIGFSEIIYMGHRVHILGLMQQALSRTIDAKWAIIIYHDYIQRAYDNMYNGNLPSIRFPGEDMKESTGNIKGSYIENVHIPKTNYDPY